MAREVIVGIVVNAKDAASATVSKIAAGVRGFGGTLDATAKRAKTAFDAVASGVKFARDAMQVGEKAVRALQQGFEATVGAAFAQRAETDQQRVAWEKFHVQIQRVAGLVGDLFIPLILGIADAFKPTLDSSEKFLTSNKKIMASGIIDWAASFARVLVAGIATGTLLVSRVWSGWVQIIGLVKSLGASAFSGILTGLDAVLAGAQAAADVLGKDEWAASIGRARTSMAELATAAQDTADVALAEVAREVAAQDTLERKIENTVDVINGGIGRASVAAYNRLGQAIHKIPPDIEKIREANEKAAKAAQESAIKTGEAVALMARKRADAQLREADATERQAKLQQDVEDQKAAAFEQQQQQLMAAADSYKSYADSVRGLLHDSIKGAIESGQDASKTLEGLGLSLFDMLLQQVERFLINKAIEAVVTAVTAKTEVLSASAVAGAWAAASTAAIPIVGPALALEAGAAMQAAVLAEFGVFHEGGIVPGRRGEEQLILAKAGEVVLTEQQASAAGVPNGPHGGRTSGNGGGGGGSFLVRTETVLPSRTTIDRLDRRTLKKSRDAGRRLGWET